jgi:hypothetical protein
MNKKKVRFNKATIFLVPNIKEQTTEILWWSLEEEAESKKNALVEINRLRSIHKTITLRDALTLLYQPNNIVYNAENF